MLESLDRPDWQTLEDAYGPAVDVPDQLSALAQGGEDWESALAALCAGIFHQGSYYSATSVAVGFLVEMLAAEATQHKDAILLFLSEMTATHVLDVPESFDPYAFRSSPPSPDYPEGIATIEAIERGADVYVALLNHSDPAVRAAAAHLCSGVQNAHSGAAEALRMRLPQEGVAGVRASFALCASRLPQAPELLSTFDTDVNPFVRASAAIGCVYAGQPLNDDLSRVLIRAALETSNEEPFPWGGVGGVAIMASFALATGAPRAVASTALRSVLEQRLARGERPIDHRALAMSRFGAELPELSPEQRAADAVLRAVAGLLAPLAFGPLAQRSQPARLAELNAEQRELLALAAEHGLPLPVAALPWSEPKVLQRLLSARDGPLERQLTVQGQRDATWCWLFRIADARTPEQDARSVLRALCSERSATELLQLCLDMLSGAYAHPMGSGLCLPFHRWDPLLERISAEAAQLESALMARAAQYDARDSRLAELLVRPLHALARVRGQELPAQLDPLIGDALSSRDETFVRELLGGLPIARRSRLVGSLLNVPAQLKLRELCDPEVLLETTLDTLASGTHSPHLARHQLSKLFDIQLLRAAQQRAGGDRRRLLDDVLAELAPVEHALVMRCRDDALEALWRAPDGVVQAEAVLPAVPKLPDLERLFGGRERPEVLRVHLEPHDHTLGYRLQRLLSELGIPTVHFGGSSLTTRS